MNSETQSLVPATRQAESEELTVEQVRKNLSVTEKGQPANTIGNCRTVFCQDPLLRDAVRLNLLTDRVDIVRDLGWRRSTSVLTDTDVKYLLLYVEQNYGLTSEKKLMAALSMQFHHLISSKRLRNIVNAFCGIYASFMVIGRVLSGVHWFTDIVGGILLSATLVMLYYSTNQLVNSKASRSSQRSR